VIYFLSRYTLTQSISIQKASFCEFRKRSKILCATTRVSMPGFPVSWLGRYCSGCTRCYWKHSADRQMESALEQAPCTARDVSKMVELSSLFTVLSETTSVRFYLPTSSLVPVSAGRCVWLQCNYLAGGYASLGVSGAHLSSISATLKSSESFGNRVRRLGMRCRRLVVTFLLLAEMNCCRGIHMMSLIHPIAIRS